MEGFIWGDKDIKHIKKVGLIRDLMKYFVVVIKCGSGHSFVRTKCGISYIFGYNGYGECLMPIETCS